MKKKIIYLSIILVLVISLISLSCIYKSKDNKYKKEYNTISKGMAIMIKEEGATDYVQSNSKDIPKGNYVLNEEKTHCENNGKVTNYNSATGKISFNFIGSDRCYLYFDYDSRLNLLGVKIPVNTNFDSSGTSGTQYKIRNKYGYRFIGTDPDNYICLDNKTSGTCSDSALLFRIVGVFNDDYSLDGTNSSGNTTMVKLIDTNHYNGTTGLKYCSSTNNWQTSPMRETLNSTYLNSLLNNSSANKKISSYILNAKWYLGGLKSTSLSGAWYQNERAPYSTSNIYNYGNDNANPTEIYDKIALIYASDYLYATTGMYTVAKVECEVYSSSEWNSNNSTCKEEDWIFLTAEFGTGDTEYLLNPAPEGYTTASIQKTGAVYNSTRFCTIAFPLRPSFYITNSAKIVGGTGTSTDPYHIG